MTQAKVPAAKVSELVVIEPAAPGRVRRPLDLVGFVVAALGAVLSLLIARFAVNTAYGIGKDLTGVAPLVPTFLLSLFSFLLGLGAVALPIAVGVDAVFRNRVRDLADGVVAAIAAGLIALLVHVWLSDVAPPQMLAGLVRGTSGGLTTQTTQPFVAALIALFTVAGVGGREGLQRVTWGVLGAGLFSAIVTGVTSPASALLTVCIGRGVGLAARYALGIKSSRPDGRRVAHTLGDHGFEVVRLDSTGEVSDRGVRRYLGLTIDGRRLDIHVFDRDQQGVGAVYRLWRRVRLRETVLRRESVSMRQSIERHVLLAYAAQQAGVATPPLLLAAEVGPEATVLAYEEWDGVPLSEAPPGFVSDQHLASAWAQLGRLRQHAIAHRNLAPSSIATEPNGGVWLRPMGLGEVAASDLELRLDVAELLCTLAAVAGPDRAVQSCRAALGEDELMAAVPLLQPIVLSSETRAAIRRNPTVLAGLRSQTLKDSATTVEPVRIERIRPRTLLTVVAGAVGAYVLLSQLGQVNVSGLLANAHWGWVGVAVAGSALTYLASALIVQGFSPVPLRLERTVLAQLAASFAALVTPPAVGGVAVNVRFVQRSGATPGLAVASIGVAQAVAFAIHLVLLAIAGYLTGSQTGADLLPARRVLIALGVALVLSALALLLPVARRLVVRRIRPFITEVVPRLLDLIQQPKRVTLGVSGNLLLNFGYVVALDAAIRAFGGVVPFWSVAIVYLAGSAIGSAAPTPGGLGAVEAALAGGLTAAGLAGDVAVSAVLLYRLATFWLPIAPGYLAFGWLQRRQAL